MKTNLSSTHPKRGMFVVIYGINNIGKTTQTKLLFRRLEKEGVPIHYIKYPVYKLKPTGPRLNAILREGTEPGLNAFEIQEIFAQNRRDWEPRLEEFLKTGYWVIAEDYKGTGISWGYTRGADLEELERINTDLLDEDLVILLDGERFLSGKELDHMNEKDDELMLLSREKHLELGLKYGWIKVNANQSIEQVHEDIWNIIKKDLQTKKTNLSTSPLYSFPVS